MSEDILKQVIEIASKINLADYRGKFLNDYLKHVKFNSENCTLKLIFEFDFINSQEDFDKIKLLVDSYIEQVKSIIPIISNIQLMFANHLAKSDNAIKNKIQNKKIRLDCAKRIILVASGKGGVGKSTISVNLALALAEMGFKIGLLDADIYGPSIPRMLGLLEVGEVKVEKEVFIPFRKYNLNIMSMGFLMPQDKAVIWRGPMITKMLQQLLMRTDWWQKSLLKLKKEPLDFLIIDTPPGTGDVHLSLAENYHIDGAIVVSTPQQVALADTKKSIDMLHKLDIPILGIIENMSYLEVEDFQSIKLSKDNLDGENRRKYIFGQNNVANYAKESQIPLIAQVPISPEISNIMDNGKSLFKSDSNQNLKEVFLRIGKIASDYFLIDS